MPAEVRAGEGKAPRGVRCFAVFRGLAFAVPISNRRESCPRGEKACGAVLFASPYRCVGAAPLSAPPAAGRACGDGGGGREATGVGLIDGGGVCLCAGRKGRFPQGPVSGETL